MHELGLDVLVVRASFLVEQDQPYTLVRVPAETVAHWVSSLGVPLRRCYVTDDLLTEKAVGGVTKQQLLEAKLPDPGAVMSGDFGEIVGFLFQGSREYVAVPVSISKWRLKEDRRKAAPHSDVVHFVVPQWPSSSAQDILLCSEVKAKATGGAYRPIEAAIEELSATETRV